MKGYLFLRHKNSKKQPIILGNNLYITKPDHFEEKPDEDGDFLAIENIPNNTSKIWISVWFDYAYGESINISNSRQSIINKSIEQLKNDYPLNSDVKQPFDMDSYVSFTLKKLEKNNCVSLKCDPLEPKEKDLLSPVLIIKEVTII